MTDPTNKNSKEKQNQSSQHESLHSRLDAIDKKLNTRRDNLDDELDAMLDKATSSLLPINKFQDEEDAIDRLLMNAGFDEDDALMQTELNKDAHVVKNVDLDDDLDGLLSFDSFGNDFNEPKKAQVLEADNSDALGHSSLNAPDDADDLDRLLMNVDLDADDEPMQPSVAEDIDTLDELDDFSDFSDFNEPETVQEDSARAVVDESVPATESSIVEDADEDDGLFGLADAFDESDMIEDDAPAMVTSTVIEEDATEQEELDSFSDFSDFNEPDAISAGEIDEAEPVTEDLPSAADELSAKDDDFFGLADNFDESDLIQDDETPGFSATDSAAAEAEAESTDELDEFSDFSDFNEPDAISADEIDNAEPVTEDLPSVADELSEKDDDFFGLADDFDESDLIQDDEAPDLSATDSTAAEAESADELDSFSDFSDFNEPDAMSAGEIDNAESAAEDFPAAADELSAKDDDFFGLADDFDASDLIEDDELGAVESPLDQGFDTEDALEQTAVETGEPVVAGLPDEVDDFGLGDEFDASDLIQDEEGDNDGLLDDSSDAANAIAQTVAETTEPVDAGFGDDSDLSDMIQDDQVEVAADSATSNDLLDGADSFNSLFADSDFGAEDALEPITEKKDEFGDDSELSEIDNFFQLNEVGDDFFAQTGEGQPAETVESSTQTDQKDDFLLPDFDITADTDMDVSVKSGDAGVEIDEFADDFGDDLFNETAAKQPFEEPIPESKSNGNPTPDEPSPQQASVSDTTVEDAKKVKLNPFDFEQEDIQKQLEEAEQKVKKARLFNYIGAGFGAVTLTAAAVLGMMTLNAKNQVSKLTEAVSTLEASLARSAANTPSQEIDDMRNSVGQLNQQVDGFITELKGNPQFPVDLLNNRVPNIVAKQDMVSKSLDMLQVKVGGLEEKAVPSPVVTELLNVEVAHEPDAATKEEHSTEIAPIKTEAAHEHMPPKNEAEHEHVKAKDGAAVEHAPTKERAQNETVATKVEPESEIAPVKAKPQPQPEAVKAKPITIAKPVAKTEPVKESVKEEPVKVKKPVPPGKWGINLVAFKQEWFAKSKAAEFAQQGIFAEVIPVHEGNTTMYRLRVGGFRSKADAYAKTAKIKNTLNLDSVWVSDN
jgi:cell division septation protein DedD